MLSFPEPPYAWPACTVVWEVELVRVLPTQSHIKFIIVENYKYIERRYVIKEKRF